MTKLTEGRENTFNKQINDLAIAPHVLNLNLETEPRPRANAKQILTLMFLFQIVKAAAMLVSEFIKFYFIKNEGKQ